MGVCGGGGVPSAICWCPSVLCMGGTFPPPSAPGGAERKQKQMSEEELQESLERAFQAYGEPLDSVTNFKYLGRVLMAGDDNWLDETCQLQKARKSWVRMSRILSWGGAEPKVLGHLFKAVVQAVLLFRGREVGPDPPEVAGPEQLSAQGSAAAHREADEAEGGGELGISSAGGGNGRSGI